MVNIQYHSSTQYLHTFLVYLAYEEELNETGKTPTLSWQSPNSLALHLSHCLLA